MAYVNNKRHEEQEDNLELSVKACGYCEPICEPVARTPNRTNSGDTSYFVIVQIFNRIRESLIKHFYTDV